MPQKFVSLPNQRAYYAAVWRIVRKIPAGKVTSYGHIAKMIPIPLGVDAQSYQAFAPRWVGGAMANCPDDVPWQRVVNAQGKISLRPGDAVNHQQELLEAEGVVFDSQGKIDMKIFGWNDLENSVSS